MSFIPRATPLALALALSACASSPVHYYTMLPPVAHEVAGRQPAPFLIDVLPVGVPAQIDQAALVVRQGDSGVTVLDSERWASPLGDEVRGALSSELAALLNTQDVAGLPTIQSSKPVVRVKVQIRRFDVWPGQRVQIAADWELGFANGPGNARVVRMGHVDEPASGGYQDAAHACQRAVMDLTARIASDARILANTR
jgi:uncharacterized lipoprotein YmbA